MLTHKPKPEFAQEPEEHYLLERIELPSVPLTLSYYITVNTSYSAQPFPLRNMGLKFSKSSRPVTPLHSALHCASALTGIRWKKSCILWRCTP